MAIHGRRYTLPITLLGDLNRAIPIGANRFDLLNKDVESTLTFFAQEANKLNSGAGGAPIVDDSRYPLRAACKIAFRYTGNALRARSPWLSWAYNISGVTTPLKATETRQAFYTSFIFRLALDGLTLDRNRVYVLTKYSTTPTTVAFYTETSVAAVNVMATAIDISLVLSLDRNAFRTVNNLTLAIHEIDVMIFYLNEDIGMAPAGGQ